MEFDAGEVVPAGIAIDPHDLHPAARKRERRRSSRSREPEHDDAGR